MNVLVCDKSQVILDRFRAILSEFPVIKNIWEVSSPQEALDFMTTSRPDVLILDGVQEIQSMSLIFNELSSKTMKHVITVVTLENLEVHYYQRFENLGANHIFDKTHQFLEMYNLFDRLFSSSESSIPVVN